MERWFITMKKADFSAVGEKYHISPILARLIRNRDVVGDEAVDFYLNGTIADLHDGMLMRDMDRAVEILAEKVREDKPIRVLGDYDIDGVNATYILQEGLSGLGADVDTDIPDRIKDGYGLNRMLIDRAIEMGFLSEGGRVSFSIDSPDEVLFQEYGTELRTKVTEYLDGRITITIEITNHQDGQGQESPENSSSSTPSQPSSSQPESTLPSSSEPSRPALPGTCTANWLWLASIIF